MHRYEKREIRDRRGLISRHPGVDDWWVEGGVHPAKQLRVEGNETRVQLLRGMAEGLDLVIRRPVLASDHSFARLDGVPIPGSRAPGPFYGHVNPRIREVNSGIFGIGT